MDPQAPTEPIIPVTKSNLQENKLETPKDNHGITIASMAVFVLFALAAVIFLYYQNQQLKSMVASYQQQTPYPTPTSTPVAIDQTTEIPIVTSPVPNTKVSSPLTIAGTVPTGWMFEGSFPIKIVDSNRDLIAQGTAKETTPGSWQSGKPVKFTVTLPFSTTDNSGFLILSNDNPSGDPEKSKTFEVPVKF